MKTFKKALLVTCLAYAAAVWCVPSSVLDELAQGMLADAAGNYEKALIHYDKVLEETVNYTRNDKLDTKPDFAKLLKLVLSYKNAVCAETQNYEAQIKTYSLLTEIHTKDPFNYFQKGQLEMNQGSYKEAVVSLQKTLELLDNTYKAARGDKLTKETLNIMLGDCRLFLGQIQEALKHYKNAKYENDKDYNTYVRIGYAYYLLQNYSGAGKEFDYALKIMCDAEQITLSSLQNGQYFERLERDKAFGDKTGPSKSLSKSLFNKKDKIAFDKIKIKDQTDKPELLNTPFPEINSKVKVVWKPKTKQKLALRKAEKFLFDKVFYLKAITARDEKNGSAFLSNVSLALKFQNDGVLYLRDLLQYHYGNKDFAKIQALLDEYIIKSL